MKNPVAAGWKILVPLVVFGLLVIVIFWWVGNDTDPLKTLSREDASRLVRIAEEANACLENEIFRDGFSLAETRFGELKEELPENLFAYRNQVILRILHFKANEELKEDSRYIEDTNQLVKELLQKDPDSYPSYLLAVRWRTAVSADIDETDIQLLEEACQRAGSSPVPHFEFYDLTIAANERDFPDINQRRQDHLAKAYDLQPDNLKLALSYLQQLAEKKDPKFQSVWSQFKTDLGPLVVAADLESFSNDHQKYSSLVDEGIAENDWGKTLLNIRFLSNKIKKGEVQKIDLARIQPHELEFLYTSLGNEIEAKALSAATEADLPPNVQLTPWQTVTGENDRPIRAVRSLDYDLDRELEIAVLYGDSLEIFKSPGNEGPWQSVVQFSLPGDYAGFVLADLDYDNTAPRGPVAPGKQQQDEQSRSYADPDFVLFGKSGVLVLENKYQPDGSRTLIPMTTDEFKGLQDVSAAILVDFDHDKDLDLVLGTGEGVRLFLSRGNLSFFDYTRFSVLPPGRVTSFDIVDFDRDIDIDVIFSRDSDSPGYLENLGHGRFRYREFEGLPAWITRTSGVSVLDVDGNRSWDWVGNIDQKNSLLGTTRTGPSLVNTQDIIRLDSGNSGGNRVLDLNNDGFSDVLQLGDGRTGLLLGNGETLVPQPLVASSSDSGPETVFAWSDSDYDDFDGDGRLDLVGLSGDGKKVEILRNTTDTANNWFAVSVCGINSNFPKGRVNNHAVGTFVEVTSGDRYMAQTVRKPRLHFGLGNHEQVDLMRFLWTSGMPQSIFRARSGQMVYEEMFEKGSCPYIYTWNGKQFTFFSDCLWAAPLGLQYAPGQMIPCRSWEYLKIPGDYLKPKEGEYVLQLTEELREAAYFDLVELYAVDHPANIDIFTNEKVGPPSIAEHRIHVVENRRLPVSAKDMYGKDVLDIIRNKDRDYFKGFQNRIAKGLTPLHYIELDLGDLEKELSSEGAGAKLTLFLHGWIRPTDCSLNISFSQNPREPGPVPPVILVPDQQGQWVKTVDPMGFPGGKPKTIAVDLSDAFLTNDYRLRIQTSHEIYWDSIFFTLGDADFQPTETKLDLVSADLHYRGFSKRSVGGPQSPELYDYSVVNRTPRWPTMFGRFTRFGNVKELLTSRDDCFAVIGAGDEMTVRFDALPEPPAGWKRDFVLHLVGYDKDADLNTVNGQTVEPLPFDGMKSYPYGAEQDFPDSPKHRYYLDQYQTRTQNWNSYWGRLSPTDSD
ncbi:MAG: CRTAC1 family protein [Planctomycetota bacterium]|nr:CRTAC1 family protein [Planctomycetota bacterium]